MNSTIRNSSLRCVRYRGVRAPGGKEYHAERNDLQQRHDDAGNENQHGDRPGAGVQQCQNPAHDRVPFLIEQGVGVHHRQQVGGYVQDWRRKAAERRSEPGYGACVDADAHDISDSVDTGPASPRTVARHCRQTSNPRLRPVAGALTCGIPPPTARIARASCGCSAQRVRA